MNKTGIEWKVGLFVVISLTLLVGLIVKFSKGSPWFTRTYDIVMRTESVAGLISGAVVQMSGVPIGQVLRIDLDPSGKTATVHLRIEHRFKIYPDARFTIKQMGFLGDRFISVVPTANAGAPLEDGDSVSSEPPFDLQEVAQSAAGLLQRVDETAKKLNDAVDRIDRSLFAEQTLTNLTTTMANFRRMSEQALSTLHGINEFVRTNSHPLSTSVSNLVSFSDQLNQVATELYVTVATNRAEVTTVVKNIESATGQLDKLVKELQAGRGLAGSLLKDEDLQRHFAGTMQNLNLLSSNLSKFGVLWKPKASRITSSTRSIYTGKNPHR